MRTILLKRSQAFNAFKNLRSFEILKDGITTALNLKLSKCSRHGDCLQFKRRKTDNDWDDVGKDITVESDYFAECN